MLPNLAEVVAFRPMAPGDVNFVLDSWLRSYRESPYAGCIPNNRFFDIMHEAVEGLLARGAKVEVACAKHDPDKILGWLCGEIINEELCLHFCYVKDPYRRMGLMTELLDRLDETHKEGKRMYTFKTAASKWLPKKWWFVPEVARRK
jgi:hypothetical protein